MNQQINEQLERLQKEISEASAEFSAAYLEYERRCKSAQIKLTHASGQFTALMSFIESKTQ